MGITQKYSLKWNDFTVNVASTFRDLHTRQDFVDVTLACSDGSTLEAHKVILSSVSTYFRDILKQTPCKHPIIILKDTGRDEASAMLEFAYTGEVNVAQELLPSLLHTARAFRIKGLDKVESPVDAAPAPPPTAPPALPTETNRWESTVRPISPRVVQQQQQDVKPPAVTTGDHFLAADKIITTSTPVLNMNGRREREVSPPPPPPAAHSSRPNSQPPTREASPCPTASSAASSNSARTPPPKRWKRSFDMTHQPPVPTDMSSQPKAEPEAEQQQPLSMIPENYSTTRPDYEPEPSKQYCESSSSTSNGGVVVGTSAAERRSLPYPHSMPTSPTMFERGNEIRLAGFIRNALANPQEIPRAPEAHSQRPEVSTTSSSASVLSVTAVQQQQQENGAEAAVAPTANGRRDDCDDVLDYSRCYNQSKSNSQSEVDYSARNGRASVNGHAALPPPPAAAGPLSSEAAAAAEEERYRRHSLIFRPESAPTVLDMSPDGSMSGPPSVRNMDLSEGHHRMNGDDSMDGHHMAHQSDDLSDCVSKAFSMTPDAMGRYNCDECGKFFKHPGSLQHHRHIHRGTHRCPSCGKAFSRRWDMERHLNKSKYGCPANRFSTGSAGSSGSSSGGGATLAVAAAAAAAAAASGSSDPAEPRPTHMELLAAASVASAASAHNTTA